MSGPITAAKAAPLKKKQAIVLQVVVDDREVARKVANADVLDHLEADDAVVGALR